MEKNKTGMQGENYELETPTQTMYEEEGPTQLMYEEEGSTRIMFEEPEPVTEVLREPTVGDRTIQNMSDNVAGELNRILETDNTELLLGEGMEEALKKATTTTGAKMCLSCFHTFKTGKFCPYCGEAYVEQEEESYYLPAGTKLNNGRYILGQAVNNGGFGIIYRGWDEVLQRVVAIKECYPASLVTRPMGSKSVVVNSSRAERYDEYQQILEDYVLEATIMSRFSKTRNVCNVYDHFKENNTAYIVMEFLEGQDLKTYRRANPNMTPEEKTEIMTQILEGVEVIHREGVVHRDIAPDNIYICKDGGNNITVKIIDFGIAAVDGKKRLKNRVVVKPGYTPPEQYLSGGATGPWTDVYAVGATLYFLFTGEVPAEVTDRQRGATLIEPKQLEARIPKNVDAAIMHALSADVEQRFQSIRELRDYINRKKAPAPAVAKSNGSAGTKGPKEKKKGKGGLIVVILLLVAALIGGGFFLFKDEILSMFKKEEASLTVWIGVSPDEEKAKEEKERYRELFDLYTEQNPEITIDLIALPEDELVDEFFAVSKSKRPDVVEVVYASEELAEELQILSFMKDNEDENTEGALKAAKKLSYQAVPMARAVELCFVLADGETIKTDSSEYGAVLEKMPGRYTVEEADDAKVWYTDFFGSCDARGNEEDAKALLTFMLSKEAQDVLHIQNDSGMLPVTEDGLNDYVKLYTELKEIKEKIADYTITLQTDSDDLYRDRIDTSSDVKPDPTKPVEKESFELEDCTKLAATEAKRRLEEKGLGVRFELEYHDTVAEGKVIGQHPEAGEDVKAGEEIILIVSQGKVPATPAPVPSPTPTPKATPTPEPSPTPEPTEAPTATPTKKPTPTPTKKPTKTPTPKPTKTPTPKPTATPYTYMNIHKAKVGSHVYFGTYEQDGNTGNGKEAIEWEVLAVEKDRVMLISRYCLDAIPYNTEATSVVWSGSSIRTWLNSTFYYEAFSQKEQNSLVSTLLENKSNEKYGTSGGEATTDRIYLLSHEEAKEIFKTADLRQVTATKYAQSKGVIVSTLKNYKGNCDWWLRTPGDSYMAMTVGVTGDFALRGNSVQLKTAGVRPVIWVSK